ncbi:MAG: paraquat-inducible protein A [Phycisphaerales bacterium]|nr:paraquat-inducible protein A [Phycisphaerales bacterium]
MTDAVSGNRVLRGCMSCGLVAGLPGDSDPGIAYRCPSCHARLDDSHASHGNLVRQRTAAFALAALVLYPAAVTLPVLKVERLGHAHETGVIGGAVELLSDGYVTLGLIVLICSVLIPLVKLLGLLVLSTRRIQVSPRHRGRIWRLIEWTGRWGMLDVLLVAAVVAMVKLGDVVDIQPGPGAMLFAAVVVLSLVSAMAFDPRAIRLHEVGDPA